MHRNAMDVQHEVITYVWLPWFSLGGTNWEAPNLITLANITWGVKYPGYIGKYDVSQSIIQQPTLFGC